MMIQWTGTVTQFGVYFMAIAGGVQKFLFHGSDQFIISNGNMIRFIVEFKLALVLSLRFHLFICKMSIGIVVRTDLINCLLFQF